LDLEYANSLSGEITSVLLAHPDIPDHRIKYPWLIGALGSIRSRVVFAAENPSLSQVQAATDPLTDGPATIESQWWQSRGDKLFRQALVESGLKSGSIASAGDWNCYVTNVIKQPDYAEKWKKTSTQSLRRHAEIWAPVLLFELLTVKPALVVALGNKAHSLLQHLMKTKLIPHYPVHKIPHYSYIALRADAIRKLGPMNPFRVQEYKQQIRHVAELADPLGD
jgi:hypothetical protein